MKALSILLALLLLVTLPAAAKEKKDKDNDRSADVSEKLKQMEQTRAQAVVKGDMDYMDKNTSDDYTLINVAGAMSNKQQMLDALKSGQLKLTQDDVSDMNVHVYGNTAVLTATGTVSGTMGGQPLDHQKVRYTRVYVKQDGAWKSVAMQQTAVK